MGPLNQLHVIMGDTMYTEITRKHMTVCIDRLEISSLIKKCIIEVNIIYTMERGSHGCLCCVRPWPTFCVGAVDYGDMKLPWSTAFHCRCSRYFA